MKKIFTLIAAMACAFSAMATTFTISSADSQTIDGITVTFARGSGDNSPAYLNDQLRLYAKNTITISGANITEVSLSFTKQGTKTYADLSASTGTLVSGGTSTGSDDVKTDTWTGATPSVTFTLGDSGQRIITEIEVIGEGSETDPTDPDDPDDPSEADSLDPDWLYDEPTTVSVPSTTVQKDPYSFIDNNILVSCTTGAITDTYFSAHAGYDLTFTATQRIKGIVINGFVKKEFTATADNGTISYLSPSEDTEANPVVVIKDVNSTSVTISCVKQLRCFSVEVYFEENPEATVSGGSSDSETDLVFDSADVVYESEYSTYVGEDNYSVFLYNAASPDLPYLSLDLYPESDDLTGTYTWDDYTLGDYTYYIWGEGDDDYTWAADGNVTISKDGSTYTIAGYIIGENDETYSFSYNGIPGFYTDEEYYYGDDGVEAIESEGNSLDSDAPMYDLNGRQVSEDYRGIIIQKGRKAVVR